MIFFSTNPQEWTSRIHEGISQEFPPEIIIGISPEKSLHELLQGFFQAFLQSLP